MSLLNRFRGLFKLHEKAPDENARRRMIGYQAFDDAKPIFLASRFADALKLYDVAVSHGLADADVFCQRGLCLQAIDLNLDAIDDFDRSIGFDPDDGGVYFMRSVSKESIGDFQGAYDDLNLAITKAAISNAANRSHNERVREQEYGSAAEMYRTRQLLIRSFLETQTEDVEKRRENPKLAELLGPAFGTEKRAKARRRST